MGLPLHPLQWNHPYSRYIGTTPTAATMRPPYSRYNGTTPTAGPYKDNARMGPPLHPLQWDHPYSRIVPGSPLQWYHLYIRYNEEIPTAGPYRDHLYNGTNLTSAIMGKPVQPDRTGITGTMGPPAHALQWNHLYSRYNGTTPTSASMRQPLQPLQ